jgi:hypothetical protein
LPPIKLTHRDVVVLVNRCGLSIAEAWEERPAWEVRALLMDQVAQLEAARKERDRADDKPEIPTIAAEEAPAWIDELPE